VIWVLVALYFSGAVLYLKFKERQPPKVPTDVFMTWEAECIARSDFQKAYKLRLQYQDDTTSYRKYLWDLYREASEFNEIAYQNFQHAEGKHNISKAIHKMKMCENLVSSIRQKIKEEQENGIKI
jgi:predicted small metal-binding protein